MLTSGILYLCIIILDSQMQWVAHIEFREFIIDIVFVLLPITIPLIILRNQGCGIGHNFLESELRVGDRSSISFRSESKIHRLHIPASITSTDIQIERVQDRD